MSRFKAAIAAVAGIVAKAMPGQHEEKITAAVDIFVPDHATRTETALFEHSRLERLAKDGERCWICNRTAEESGHPLEAHHDGIERSFAEGKIRWDLVRIDFPNYDWANFDESKPYVFVDDMMAQGLILCKEHHTGEGTGIHFVPYPLWVMQRYLVEGYQYSPGEVIVHQLT